MEKESIKIKFIYKEFEYPFFVQPSIEFNVLDLKVKSILNEFSSVPEKYLIYYLSAKEGNEKLISNNNDLKEVIENHLNSNNDSLKIKITNEDNSKSVNKNQILVEQENILNENVEAHSLGYSVISQSSIIPKEPCSKCNENIKSIKYICMLCHNYFLCENCYGFHSKYHPMILTNKDNFLPANLDYMSYLLHNYKDLKMNNTYKVNIHVFVIDKRFAMKKNSFRSFNILIKNIGNLISEEISLIFTNTNDIISVKPRLFSNLKKNEKYLLKIEVNSYDKEGHIFPNIELYCGKAKIKYNETQLEIKVINDNDCYDENVEMLFGIYPNLKSMSRVNKFKIYNGIKTAKFLLEDHMINIEQRVKKNGVESLFRKNK